ncbi:Putative E3 ubiquitin-protein ligase HERC1, partial [Durusdinium trenchii]
MDTSQRGEEAEQVPSSNPNPTEPTLDDERELSYADINQKRKQLTFQSFQDPSFLQKITILDSLIQPNVGAMYKMFQRTGILGKLCYLPEDARDDKQELMNKSTAFFKDYMTGVFGKQLVKEYIEKLKLMPHVGIETDSLFSDYFILCLLQIGECWRRFCYNLSSFPHALWRVLGLKERELCMQLAEFQRQVSKCTVCADPEFTAVLLSQLPNVIDCENPEHVQQAVKLQQVLADLACVNRRLAKYHNKSASADPSKERTRLKLIFSHLQMLSNAGPGDDGWNIFQREWFQGRPPVPPGEYAAEVRRCGKEWARVSEDVRSSFQDKAVLEQSLREEAMKQPFPSKHGKPDDLGGAAFDAVSELCPKAVKKISQPRLVQTYNRYSHSDMWSTSSMGLASADGCLRLDLIDTETPDKDIQSHMATAFHNPAPACESDIEEELPGCHHETCWEAFGHCQRKIHAVLARKFVRSLKYFLTN